MIVDRELAIRNFVPEDYRNVVATFSPRAGDKYNGTWFRPGVEPMDAAAKLAADGEEAKAICDRVRTGQAQIEKIEAQTQAHVAAAVIRPDRVAAACEPAVLVQRAAHTRTRASAL